MKCINCNEKVNCRNVIRLCKENPDTHIFCKSCFQNHLFENKESNIVLCPSCNSFVYKKRNIQDIDFDDSILKTFLCALTLYRYDTNNNE